MGKSAFEFYSGRPSILINRNLNEKNNGGYRFGENEIKRVRN